MSWGWKVKMKAALLCLTLCDPMDYTALGILQTRILEWVAFSLVRHSVRKQLLFPHHPYLLSKLGESVWIADHAPLSSLWAMYLLGQ